MSVYTGGMKTYYKVAIVIIAIGFISWFFYAGRQKTPVQDAETLLEYSNDVYGISFSYPSDYILSERDTVASDSQNYHQIGLINKKDIPLPVSGEGPTAIILDIYKNNVNKYSAESWARNAKESNLKLGEGRISTTTISGLAALSFRWSGLYEGTTIVLAKPDFVYTFNVTYLEMGGQIIQDFVKIRDSVRITSSPTKEEKIKLYYYNPKLDQGPGGVQCTKKGLVPVERVIPATASPLTDAITRLLRGEIS